MQRLLQTIEIHFMRTYFIFILFYKKSKFVYSLIVFIREGTIVFRKIYRKLRVQEKLQVANVKVHIHIYT